MTVKNLLRMSINMSTPYTFAQTEQSMMHYSHQCTMLIYSVKTCTGPFLRIIANVSSIIFWVHSNFPEEHVKGESRLETVLKIVNLTVLKTTIDL